METILLTLKGNINDAFNTIDADYFDTEERHNKKVELLLTLKLAIQTMELEENQKRIEQMKQEHQIELDKKTDELNELESQKFLNNIIKGNQNGN